MIRHSLSALALLTLTALAPTAFADGLSARISSDSVAMGDSFQLTLSADPAELTAAPDISALNKDFDILGTSKSMQTRVINGARSETVAWIITLAPRNPGHLTIASLNAGAASSDALTLDVVDAANLPPVSNLPGASGITVDLKPGAYYVQQEMPLTVQITIAPGFRDGAIEAPQSPDFVLEQRGEDRVSRPAQKGAALTVIERDYLLRPQKSGTLTVAPFTLRGTADDISPISAPRRDPFASLFGGAGSPFARMLAPGRPVTLRSAPLTVEIKAKPDASVDWFLPARDVSLSARWDTETPAFRVGEAVLRHVRITALGATGVQLPDLAQPDAAGARVYLDRSDLGTVNTPDGPSAVRDFSYSIVPTSGGTLTLPEVTVQWFDTASETSRVAMLPAETLMVDGPVTPAPNAQTGATLPAPALADTGHRRQGTIWLWVIGLTFVAMAGAIFLSRRSRRLQGSALRAAKRRASMVRIETACAARDPAAAYGATVAWSQLAARCGELGLSARLAAFPDLRTRWQDLETRVFAGEASAAWDAAGFLKAIRATGRRVDWRSSLPRRAVLPPLYAPLASANLSHL